MSPQPLVDPRIFLGNNPLFADLARKDLDDLLAITQKQQYRKNAVVVHQNKPGDDMYIISKGSVEVYLHLADDEDISLGRLGIGDAFGEIALFDPQERTASIITCEPCEFVVIGRPEFESYLITHPHVAIQLLQVMAKRARATDDFLKDKMYSDIADRLASILNNIAHAYGKNTSDGLKIEMKFADQELGQLAGIPVDAVTAQLRKWEKSGIIHKRFGYLTLVRPEELSNPM